MLAGRLAGREGDSEGGCTVPCVARATFSTMIPQYRAGAIIFIVAVLILKPYPLPLGPHFT
jgi:hypothetical protein